MVSHVSRGADVRPCKNLPHEKARKRDILAQSDMKARTAQSIGRAGSKPRRRRIVQSVLVGIGFVALLDALFGERGLVEMTRTIKGYEELQSTVDAMKRDNERMREEIQRLERNDPDAVEDVAREDLGLIKRGEKVFTIREAAPQEKR